MTGSWWIQRWCATRGRALAALHVHRLIYLCSNIKNKQIFWRTARKWKFWAGLRDVILTSSVTAFHIPIPRKSGFFQSEIHRYSHTSNWCPRKRTLSSFKNAASRRLKNGHLGKYQATDFSGRDVIRCDRGLRTVGKGPYLIHILEYIHAVHLNMICVS